jgi:hypothetical protein
MNIIMLCQLHMLCGIELCVKMIINENDCGVHMLVLLQYSPEQYHRKPQAIFLAKIHMSQMHVIYSLNHRIPCLLFN